MREGEQVECVDPYHGMVAGETYTVLRSWQAGPDNTVEYLKVIGTVNGATGELEGVFASRFRPLPTFMLPPAAQHASTLPGPAPRTTLPLDSAARKEYPLWSGPFRCFPAALAALARHCKLGNDKHNPGEELHHARSKSTDHADCIGRHLLDLSENGGLDENGEPQVNAILWRAAALCQEWHEKHRGAPLAPGARL